MHSGSTGRGATIRILLLDGTPDGLRLIYNSNWSGLAMMCSRAKYPAIKIREEFDFPGVYLLYSPTGIEAKDPTLYIGQADNVRERLDSHYRAKEFWSHFAVFTSTSGHLNRAHAHYLESRLIGLALKARRAKILNGNAPRPPYLSESDRFDSESFLDQVLLLAPILGLDFFTPLAERPPSEDLTPSPPPPSGIGQVGAAAVEPDGSIDLFLATSGARASGRTVGKGIEVFAGSIARKELQPSAPDWIIELRRELIASGTLAPSPEGLVFTRNYVFRSSSAAACALIGRTANGLLNWKDSKGRTLKRLQQTAGRG